MRFESFSDKDARVHKARGITKGAFRCLGIGIVGAGLLSFGGCNKLGESESGRESANQQTEAERIAAEERAKAQALEREKANKEQAEADAKQRFNSSVEISKSRAVREYPELEQPGSDLYREFTAQVKALEDANSRELKRTDWPYVLAKRIAQDLQNKKSVEASKLRAVNEFPELKIAGSEMNLEFVRRAKLLQETNDVLLQNTDWPFQLASRIAADLYNPSRTYSVTELQGLKELPFREIQIRGLVTDVDRSSLSSASGGQIVLERALSCEFTIPSNGPSDSGTTLVRKGDALCLMLRSKSAKNVGERVLFRVGQEVTVRGRCTRRNDGKLIFKFDMDLGRAVPVGAGAGAGAGPSLERPIF